MAPNDNPYSVILLTVNLVCKAYVIDWPDFRSTRFTATLSAKAQLELVIVFDNNGIFSVP